MKPAVHSGTPACLWSPYNIIHTYIHTHAKRQCIMITCLAFQLGSKPPPPCRNYISSSVQSMAMTSWGVECGEYNNYCYFLLHYLQPLPALYNDQHCTLQRDRTGMGPSNQIQCNIGFIGMHAVFKSRCIWLLHVYTCMRVYVCMCRHHASHVLWTLCNMVHMSTAARCCV